MKVYAVIMDWEFRGDRGTSFSLYATKAKAQEMLEKFKQEEFANSWISEIEDIYNIDNYDDEPEYFDCCDGDRRTTIWIEEKEIV